LSHPFGKINIEPIGKLSFKVRAGIHLEAEEWFIALPVKSSHGELEEEFTVKDFHGMGCNCVRIGL
jgi:hypothetical protein